MSTSSPATSLQWHLPESPAPKLLVLPGNAVSLDEANAAIELWEHYKRRRLDPWQRLSVQLKLAIGPDGLWAAKTTGAEVPRQAGKGDDIEVAEFWGLMERGERILHTIHDAVLLATEAHRRMLTLIESHPDLRRKMKRAWSGTGQQMIEMRNGGQIWYRTRTGGGGRGVDDVDRVVIDEAQHAESGQIEAISPTQLASVNPQTNVMGTGGLAGKSAWWWTVRRRAVMPDPGEFAYIGYTAESLSMVDGRVVAERPDVSTLERFLEVVREVHPALARRPELIKFFAEEYRKLGPEGASREYLLMWDPEPTDVGGGAISRAVWDGLAEDAEVTSGIRSQRCWSLAVSPDRQWAAIGVAGRSADGRLHVEFRDRRPGTHWVVERVVEAWNTLGIPIRVASGTKSAASSFVPLLREQGVEVVEVGAAEVAQAVGQFIDAVNAGQLVHIGQAALDKAVGVAVVGPSGRWLSLDPSVELSPLEAVTVAAGGVPAAAESEFFAY